MTPPQNQHFAWKPPCTYQFANTRSHLFLQAEHTAKTRKYLCAEPGRKHELFAEPASPNLLGEPPKVSLTVLSAVQELSCPLPSAEGVQFTNPAPNYSPLTEAHNCNRTTAFTARGISTRYDDLTDGYLLKNCLWLQINISLKNKVSLLALCHPADSRDHKPLF